MNDYELSAKGTIMTYTDIINDITKRYPDLDVAGLDKDEREPASHDWTYYEDAFAPCLDYLATLRPLASYSKHAPSSYGLKHDVEHVTNSNGKRVYDPNGVMIAALIHKGIRFKRDGINAVVRVSPASRVKRS